jgi:FtsZ-binding cell division protein ZapB
MLGTCIFFYGGDGQISNGGYYALVSPNSEPLSLVSVPIGPKHPARALLETASFEYADYITGQVATTEQIAAHLKKEHSDRISVLVGDSPRPAASKRKASPPLKGAEEGTVDAAFNDAKEAHKIGNIDDLWAAFKRAMMAAGLLEDEITTLKTKHKKLKTEHSKLQEQYSALQENCNTQEATRKEAKKAADTTIKRLKADLRKATETAARAKEKSKTPRVSPPKGNPYQGTGDFERGVNMGVGNAMGVFEKICPGGLPNLFASMPR